MATTLREALILMVASLTVVPAASQEIVRNPSAALVMAMSCSVEDTSFDILYDTAGGYFVVLGDHVLLRYYGVTNRFEVRAEHYFFSSEFFAPLVPLGFLRVDRYSGELTLVNSADRQWLGYCGKSLATALPPRTLSFTRDVNGFAVQCGRYQIIVTYSSGILQLSEDGRVLFRRGYSEYDEAYIRFEFDGAEALLNAFSGAFFTSIHSASAGIPCRQETWTPDLGAPLL